jgi:glutaredoxin-like protein NrdH
LPPTLAGICPTLHPKEPRQMEAVTDLMPREDAPVIKVYSKTPCVQCNAVKNKLKKELADFEVVDVGLPENAGDLEALQALGYMTVPVTFVNDEHFPGFDPDRLMDAVARQRRATMHLVMTEAAVA